MLPDAMEEGFYLWKLRKIDEDEGYEIVSSRLVQSPKHFN